MVSASVQERIVPDQCPNWDKEYEDMIVTVLEV